ncbi:MAG TPA: hypothetical protein VK613_08890, partial [Gaiellaceae bacterium]|nr:hypothetical protein [Gaiellaceae bacterium]
TRTSQRRECRWLAGVLPGEHPVGYHPVAERLESDELAVAVEGKDVGALDRFALEVDRGKDNDHLGKCRQEGQNVVVVGMVNPTTRTITASQVIVKTTGGGSATTKVVPLQPGAPSTAKQVGQIPANYTQGSGTIVSGTTANKATKAALTAYQGGIVDRVVKLGNGEYEVHNIGVNWPHHIFVNKYFKVIGAN